MSDELFNRQAEGIVLSGMLRLPENYWDINDIELVSQDFGGRENRNIFTAIQRVADDKRTPDISSVLESLRSSGHGASEEYMSRLLQIPCSLAEAKHNAAIVKGLAISRKLQVLGVHTIEAAREARSDYEEALSAVESEFAELRRVLPRVNASSNPADIIADIKSRSREPGIPIRFSPSLNYVTSGLQPGWLWVVGGFSSVGKSALAVNFIRDILQTDGKWAGVISTEMPKESYVIRLLSLLSGVNQRSIRERVALGTAEISAIEGAERLLADSSLRIFDSVYDIKGIRSTATRMKKMEGLDVLIVDFIQNLSITGDEVADARSAIIGLQQLAKELGITVVAFSQISNEMAMRQSDNPDSDYYSFKGHGAIRDAADVAIMLKRNQQGESPELEMRIVKNRHEQLAKIRTRIHFETGRIEELNSDR